LKDIPNHKNRTFKVVANSIDVRGYQFRISISWLSPMAELQVSLIGAATGFAIIGATPTGKDGGEGVQEPVGERGIAGEVSVPCYLAHDMGIVDDHPIEVRRDVGQGVDYNLSIIPPGEIRDLRKVSPTPNDLHELEEGFLCRISPNHIIHVGISLDDLFVKVGSGETPKDDGGVGVIFFDDCG